MVAQSGGPTVAINASLAGVIRGVMASDQYETVYGSVNGILGILNNHLLNLTEIMNENPAYLDRLETTPAMYSVPGELSTVMPFLIASPLRGRIWASNPCGRAI